MKRALTQIAGGQEPSVVVFPHAGGSPRFYRHWDGVFRGTAVLGAVYPGRDHRIDDSHPGTLQELADEIVAELAEHRVDLLFGHSMGAAVAYEVAHGLADRGRHPLLVVSGRDAPSALRSAGAPLHSADESALIGDLVRLDRRNAEVFGHTELKELFLPVVRGDYRLIETYEPASSRRPLRRIAVVNGCDDSDVTAEGSLAWGDLAEEFLGIHEVPGGHFHHAAPSTDCAQLINALLRAGGQSSTLTPEASLAGASTRRDGA